MLARRSIAVVAILLVIAFCVLWFSRRSSEADEKVDAGTSATAPIVGESRVAPSTPIEPVATPESVRIASEVAAPAPTAASPSTKFTLHGTVTVVDPDATLATPIDGTLRCTVRNGERISKVRASIQAGEWSTEIDKPEGIAHVTIQDVRIGRATLIVDSPTDDSPLPPDGKLDIVARVPPGTMLRVLDARDRHDLPGVMIVKSAQFPDENLDHPGLNWTKRVALSNATSPVRLTSNGGLQPGRNSICVGAEGYAWKHAVIDTSTGGEQIVELQRGGDLEIHVRGLDGRAQVALRLRQESNSSPFASVDLGTDDTVEFRGLRPGPLRVDAEIGAWYSEPIVLAEATAEVVEGRSTSVELELVQAPALELATASGRVLVPKEWAVERAVVMLELLDTPLDGSNAHRRPDASRAADAPEGFDAFDWRIGSVQAGGYRLELYEPFFAITIELPPGETTGIELRVPPPVDLLLRVVEAGTGESIDDVAVLWHPAWSEGMRSGRIKSVKFDEAASGYAIRAPDTAIDLQIHDERFAPYSARWDPTRDGRERVIRLERACGFELSLQDGETRMPLLDDWWGEVAAADGTIGAPSMVGLHDGALQVTVTAPGTYTIQPPSIDGYEQAPLQRIEVRAGEFTKHVVQLERKKL